MPRIFPILTAACILTLTLSACTTTSQTNTSQTNATDEALVMEVYDVRDIIMTDAIAPDLQKSREDPNYVEETEPVQRVIRMMEHDLHVMQDAPADAFVSELSGRLVVRHTPQMQRVVKAWLEGFQSARNARFGHYPYLATHVDRSLD